MLSQETESNMDINLNNFRVSYFNKMIINFSEVFNHIGG